ncbi:hypothetical protein AMATHDRAFT_5822 [Amanita thiersii Skay4041]|uniref:Uncharacterized protein n=1 Tax=Amanita thiersii Skay4041 TaxID=703135 RepID=A0A2A9NL48_9AGAR|nr:hypothetical protein AMATHDRAFT_5822 [Amanita thiersii Skay4041]
MIFPIELYLPRWAFYRPWRASQELESPTIESQGAEATEDNQAIVTWDQPHEIARLIDTGCQSYQNFLHIVTTSPRDMASSKGLQDRAATTVTLAQRAGEAPFTNFVLSLSLTFSQIMKELQEYAELENTSFAFRYIFGGDMRRSALELEGKMWGLCSMLDGELRWKEGSPLPGVDSQPLLQVITKSHPV